MSHAGPRLRLPRKLRRALLAATVVLLAGTLGYSLIEQWSLGQSLYFTLISITTVGYGDDGLSERGKLFTIGVLLGGIATMSYALGLVVQTAIEYQLDKERRMRRAIDLLSDHFIVCGLGRLGLTVCARLSAEAIPLVAIDLDADAAERMSARGIPTIVGDATEDKTLQDAGVARARGLICVSGSDADNIVITLSARDLSPSLEIISRAEHEESVRKLERAGASRVVSTIRTGGSRIVESILRPHLADFLERAQWGRQDFEIAEVKVEAGSPMEGQTTVHYCAAHPEVVLVALHSGGVTRVRPSDDETLRAGDLLFVAGRSQAVATLCVDARAA